VTENPYQSPIETTPRDDRVPVGLGPYVVAVLAFLITGAEVLLLAVIIGVFVTRSNFEEVLREMVGLRDATRSVMPFYGVGSALVAVLVGTWRAVASLKKSRHRAARKAALIEQRRLAVEELKQRARAEHEGCE